MFLFLHEHLGSYRSRKGSRATGDAGFTLVELLVVLVILVLLASLVGPRVIGFLGGAKSKAAKVQIEGFAAALELYKLDNGRFPSTSEGLRALVEKPGSAATWNGPYLRKQSVPADPWNRPFQYRAPGQRSEFEIFSLGADGQQGGTGENADVTSWN